MMQLNMIGVTFQLMGFLSTDPDQPPQPAPSPRQADLLTANWILNNMRSEALELTFPDGILFDLEILRADSGDVIWRLDYPASDEPITVTVAAGQLFGVPPTVVDDDDEDIPDSDVPPLIPLRSIVEELQIPPELELVARFRCRAQEFPQEVTYPLWR